MTDGNTADKPRNSLRSRTARGVAWMMALKLAIRSLSIVSTLILVRLLTPADFGLVAMAMVLIMVMDLFTWFSFDVVLIQKQDATRKHYDTAWTFNVLFKTFASGSLLILAFPAALYFSEPRVTALVLVLALGEFANGFTNIGLVDFRKNMQFDRDFKFMFLCKLSGFLVTVPLAFILRDYWALIYGQVFSKLFAVAASYAMHPYRPRFSLAARHELFNFSKWLIFNNAAIALRNRAAEFIVGRVSGARDLGLFNISHELSNMPTTDMVQPINRAVFPAYAQLSGQLESLRRGYVSVMAVISLVAVPAGLGIGATAKLIVPIALGEQWLTTIPLFTILALNGALVSMQTNIASVFFALAKPHILTYINLVSLALLLSLAIPATQIWGIQGTAMAYLTATITMMPIVFTATFRTLQLPVVTFLSNVWRPTLAASVMYVVTRTFCDYRLAAADGAARIVDLVAAIALGGVVYVGLIGLLWFLSGRPSGAESYILDTLAQRLAARRQARSQS